MAQSDFNRAAALLERLGVSARADVVSLYAARAARGFGDGFAAIILPAYLIEIGFDPFQIGLVATAALLGSAATTLAMGFLGGPARAANASSDLGAFDDRDRNRDPKPLASGFHRDHSFHWHDEPDHWRYRGACFGG